MNTNPKANQAAVVLFGVAALLLASIVTHSWFASENGGVGLLGVKHCGAHACESQFWFAMHGAPTSFVLLGLVGLGAGLGAIAMLGHTAIMLTRGTPTEIKLQLTRTFLVVGLFAALLFVALIEIEEHRGLHLGWSAIAGLIAGVAGLVALSQMVAPMVSTVAAVPYVPPMAMPTSSGPSHQPIPAFPLTMQEGMNRMHGHVFLAQGRLYFVCVKTGGAWLAAIGQGVGGLVGGALAGLAIPTVNGAPAIFDETQLHQAVSTMPGSIVMEAHNIQQIKETWAWRLIRANGKKYGLPKGLGRDLKAALGPWARYHQVRTVGFA